MPACEMAALANKASDVKERPSPPIELVKVRLTCLVGWGSYLPLHALLLREVVTCLATSFQVVLHERGGTMGTATGFVEDGLRLVPVRGHRCLNLSPSPWSAAGACCNLSISHYRIKA